MHSDTPAQPVIDPAPAGRPLAPVQRQRGCAGVFGWGVAILGAAAFAFFYLGLPGLFGTDAGPRPSAAAGETVAVETVIAQVQPIDDTIRVVGELYPFDQAQLGLQVEGYVRELYFEAGDAVTAGEPMAVLDTRDFQVALERAEAELQRVRAGLGLSEGETRLPEPSSIGTVRRARAALEGDQRNVARVRELAEFDSATPAELDVAETAYEVARHAYQEALELARERIGLLGVREAEAAQARLNLDHATLRAPFSGMIWHKLTGPGEFLEVGDPVYAIVQTDRLRLRLDVPERDARLVAIGQEVRFRFDDDDAAHTGAIARIFPSLDTATRVMRAEVEIDNPGDWLPGYFVRADIVIAEGVPSVIVPRDAVSSFVGIHRVFVVEDGAADAREVTLGRTHNGHIVITHGLEGGEAVILNPGTLRSGTPVDATPRSAS